MIRCEYDEGCKPRTKSLNVKREHLLVLDEIIDLKTVGGDSTLCLPTNCACGYEVRHREQRNYSEGFKMNRV